MINDGRDGRRDVGYHDGERFGRGGQVIVANRECDLIAAVVGESFGNIRSRCRRTPVTEVPDELQRISDNSRRIAGDCGERRDLTFAQVGRCRRRPDGRGDVADHDRRGRDGFVVDGLRALIEHPVIVTAHRDRDRIGRIGRQVVHVNVSQGGRGRRVISIDREQLSLSIAPVDLEQFVVRKVLTWIGDRDSERCRSAFVDCRARSQHDLRLAIADGHVELIDGLGFVRGLHRDCHRERAAFEVRVIQREVPRARHDGLVGLLIAVVIDDDRPSVCSRIVDRQCPRECVAFGDRGI